MELLTGEYRNTLDEKGRITAANVKKAMNKNTKLIAIAQVSNVLGYVVDIKEIAKHLDTIPYEVICSISKRVPRIYKY